MKEGNVKKGQWPERQWSYEMENEFIKYWTQIFVVQAHISSIKKTMKYFVTHKVLVGEED